ncbi:Fe-S cluster assembly protein SufD [Haliangium sp.]|uniref:Fe-S cluster assembly protein SufD n=1 Tax=Haliangium sp. TaxID=2663208 RepID=UPI003D10B121
MSGHRLLDDLSARTPTGDPAEWLAAVRADATAALSEGGLPTRKHESWRFTPLRGIVDRLYEPAHQPTSPDPGQAREIYTWLDQQLDADDSARVAVVDGRLCPPPTPALPAGVELVRLADADDELRRAAATLVGRLARVEHFAALNAALFEDLVLLRVRAGARPDVPVHLVYTGAPGAPGTDTTGAAVVCYPRVLVMLDPGAELCLIETALMHPDQPRLVSAVTEIALAPETALEHVRVHRGAPAPAEAYCVAHVAVRQDRGSRYDSRVVTLGGALTRLDLDVTLAGPNAACRLDGAYHAGRGDHVDHQTRIDHEVPSCTSHERYHGIVDETGHAVFDGTIVVRPGAQHTDAHQENRNLLLSDDAVVNTKPHLRIDADDVSCSHGATVGALDDDQLFYLRARGVDEARARAVLTYAFIRAVVDDIPHRPLAASLAAAVRARLPHGEDLED